VLLLTVPLSAVLLMESGPVLRDTIFPTPELPAEPPSELFAVVVVANNESETVSVALMNTRPPPLCANAHSLPMNDNLLSYSQNKATAAASLDDN
jgi:hypothetical protein